VGGGVPGPFLGRSMFGMWIVRHVMFIHALLDGDMLAANSSHARGPNNLRIRVREQTAARTPTRSRRDHAPSHSQAHRHEAA